MFGFLCEFLEGLKQLVQEKCVQEQFVQKRFQLDVVVVGGLLK